jgi:hypothetical protein
LVIKYRNYFEGTLTLSNIVKKTMYIAFLAILFFAAGETALRVRGFKSWEGPPEIEVDVKLGGKFYTQHARLDETGGLQFHMARILYREFPFMLYSAFMNLVRESLQQK